jgi:predicted nucleic acid-binding protein
MIVIADTSPLNYLIRLGHADLLRVIYGDVFVPSAVLRELRHPEASAEVSAWASAPPAWLGEVHVSQMDTSLPAELALGEREAISLTVQVKADLLLMDERAGRQQAESRKIAIAGTLAVLLVAAARGHIDFPASIAQLKRFGFRISKPLEALLVARSEQSKEPRL